MSGSVSRRTVRCALAAAARGSRRRTRGATVTGIIGASPVETTGVIVGDAAAAKNDAAPTLITNALLRLIVCMVR